MGAFLKEDLTCTFKLLFNCTFKEFIFTESLSACGAPWSFLFYSLSIASMLRRITGVIR
jgi:hypothetical protein